MPVPDQNRSSRSPDSDTTFYALASSQRRAALVALDAADGPLSMVELATAVLELERDPSSASTDADYERTILSLTHTHLPNLVDADLISIDSDDRVALTGAGRDHPVALSLARWSLNPDRTPSGFSDVARGD